MSGKQLMIELGVLTLRGQSIEVDDRRCDNAALPPNAAWSHRRK